MGLFGTKAKLLVELQQESVVAGTPLTVRWSAGDVADAKVRSGRLELVYDNRFTYLASDGDGNDKKKRRTRRVVAVTQELFAGQPPSGVQETTIEVPSSPASAPDAVDWFVVVVLDRSGRDVHAERGLTVTAPSEALESWSRTEPTISSGACVVQIEVEPRVVRAGDTVRGTVGLSASKDVSARSVRVELLRRRHEHNGIQKGHVEQAVTLEKGSSIAATQPRQLAFELPIVDAGGPSFEAEHNSQHWYVQAVVDRRMSTDFTSMAEIVVYNA